jgi:cyclophilin family peptidyl-prolyl cis-trans isomerase
MAQIRRPNRNPQRITLLRLFLGISGTLFFAICLFYYDGFPDRKQRAALRAAAANGEGDASSVTASVNKRPLLTPEKLLAQDFIRNQRVQAVKATEANSRRFLLHLGGLVPDSHGNTNGTVVLETRPSWAPIGVKHLHDLMDAKFYDQCRFFRVIPNFMVQFGIAADPNVQRVMRETVLPDDSVQQTNARGTVSFAMSGKNSRTTQLFINTKTAGNRYLDKEGFAPVAVVLQGMEYVDRIYADDREKPVQAKIQNRGNEYLNKEFPNLSYIDHVEEVLGDAAGPQAIV